MKISLISLSLIFFIDVLYGTTSFKKLSLKEAVILNIKNSHDYAIKKLVLDEKKSTLQEKDADGEPAFSLDAKHAKKATPSLSDDEENDDDANSGVDNFTLTSSLVASYNQTIFRGTSISVPYTFEREESRSEGETDGPFYEPSAEVKITQPVRELISGEYSERSIRETTYDVAIKSAEVKISLFEEAKKTINLYLDLLEATKKHELNKAFETDSKENIAYTKKLIEAGKSSRVDLLESKKAFYKAQIASGDSEDDKMIKSSQLSLRLGIDEITQLQGLSDKYINIRKPNDLKTLSNAALKANYELTKYNHKYEKADFLTRVAEREVGAELSLSGAFGIHGIGRNPQDSNDKMLNGEQTSYSTGITIKRPLFLTGQNAAYDIKKTRQRKEKLLRENAKKELLLDLRVGLRKYMSSINKYSALKKALQAEMESYYAQRELFRKGKVSIMDLNKASTDLLQSKIDSAKAKIAVVRSYFELSFLTGSILNDLDIPTSD